jgi:predicted nuclease of predicted toxin-antitoxin system
MKFLCDVHISYQLVDFINSKGFEALHINTILNKWFTKDKDICRFADKNDYVVITKDIDFKNVYFINNTPKKLIWICLDNISNKDLVNIFDKNLNILEKYFIKDRCYLEINKETVSVIGVDDK